MGRWFAVLACCAAALALLLAAQNVAPEQRLERLRNLGKAFYENPTTQAEAVEQFRRALALAPKSTRERLNFGLALLRAGKTDEGIAQLQQVQQQDPALPHTWFNLGIAWKKAGEHERATAQFERMVQLVPDDPISHYNLGALYKILGKQDAAVREFERSAELDPNLAAPRFQLFNAYRTSGRQDEARKQLERFQQLKKQQEGAAIPEDVEWNAYAEVYDAAPERAPEPAGPLKFTARPLPAATDGAIALDVNGDGRAELLVWSSGGARLEPGAAIPDVANVVSAAAGDFNNDGKQDVCVLTTGGPLLLVNNAGKLSRSPVALPAGSWHQAVWIDYDHDYDLDLLLLGEKSVLLRNAGAAGFEDRTADFPFVSGEALSGVELRVVADTKGFDVAVSYRGRGAVLYRDHLQGRYTAEDLPLPAGATALAAADLDSDGYFDLLYVADQNLFWSKNVHQKFAAGAKLAEGAQAFALADLEHRGVLDIAIPGVVLRRTGMSAFARTPNSEIPPQCSGLTAADLNGDALPDLVCAGGSGGSVLTNSTGPGGRRWIGVQLTGVKNLQLAAGSEIEVKSGSLYQKRPYEGLPLVFGLGRDEAVDTVRITWPNGLIQNEIRQAPGKVYTYKEAQRLSGSCPIIWTWNGTGFQYITDVLGVAPLGATAGEGRYFPVDHDEYVQIPGAALQPRDGEYEIRITEELSEVAFLDEVSLIAVDSPVSVDIFTNEKFKGPPFPEFRLYGVTRRIPPTSARDEKGRDVTSEVLHRDERYPDGFDRQLSGVAALHHLDLDFAGSAADNRAVLVMHGWVDWADGSTFLGVAQEGRGGLIPPSLQVRDETGRWVTVIEDMGMPAGKPKTIVVDLSGKFLSASREVRIVTNLSVYWDEIFLSEETGAPPATLRNVPPVGAGLRFRGFSPNRVHPQRRQPEKFTYEGASPVSLWNPTPGRYTRYGDVRDLTGEVDDRMVVMGSGDELVLRFRASALAPLRTGWQRNFLLKVDGWAKDRDANTAFSQTTEPLPFHGMSQYPYGPGEQFPDTDANRTWREKYLTRPALRLLRPLRPAM